MILELLPESVSLKGALYLGAAGLAFGIILTAVVVLARRRKREERYRAEIEKLKKEWEKERESLLEALRRAKGPGPISRLVAALRHAAEERRRTMEERERRRREAEDREILAHGLDPSQVARMGTPLRYLPVTIYTLCIVFGLFAWLVLSVFSVIFGPALLFAGGGVGMFLLSLPTLFQFRLRRITNREDPDASKFHLVPPHPAVIQWLSFRRRLQEYVMLGVVHTNGDVRFLVGPAKMPYVKVGADKLFRIPRLNSHDGTWNLQAPEGVRMLLYPSGISEPMKQPGYNERIYEALVQKEWMKAQVPVFVPVAEQGTMAAPTVAIRETEETNNAAAR